MNKRITSGISRTGGKYRLLNTILDLTPSHNYFLSCFLGSGIYEINKPRCKFEVFNDIDSELINYFLMIREYPEEFDNFKKGIFGVVSQEIFNRIISGKLQPKTDLERAFFYYYINKVSFGGLSKTYRGIKPLHTSISDNKGSYRGMSPPGGHKNEQGYLGVNMKTTRPFSNNDNGLLTPLNQKCIKRLRYVNITSYEYDKAYKMFSRGLLKKQITEPVFLYFDPPYPKTESYYQTGFGMEDHLKLINEILIPSPFKCLLSIGTGDDCLFYIEALEKESWIIKEVEVKYSTSANHQKPKKEYLIMNYDIDELPLMQFSSEQNHLGGWL